MSRSLFCNCNPSLGLFSLDVTFDVPSSFGLSNASMVYYVGYYVGTSFRCLTSFSNYKDASDYLERNITYNGYKLLLFSLFVSLSFNGSYDDLFNS